MFATAPRLRFLGLAALAILVASILPSAVAQDVPTLKELPKLVAPEFNLGGRVAVRELAFSPDGKELFAAGEGGVVWNLKTGETKSVTNNTVLVAAYTKDGKKRLLGHNPKVGWTTQDVKTGKFTDGLVVFPLGSGTSLGTELSVYSPDGKTVLSVPVFLPTVKGKPPATHYQLRVYDPATGKELRAFPARHTESLLCLARSADGKVAVSGSRDMTARAWDFATGKELSVFKEHPAPVYRVAVAPDGKLAASSSHFFPNGPKDGKFGDFTISVWETKTGKVVAKFEEHKGLVNALAITPDGKSVVSVGDEGGAGGRLWELATGKELGRFTAQSSASGIAISPDGKTVAVSMFSETGIVRMWQLP